MPAGDVQHDAGPGEDGSSRVPADRTGRGREERSRTSLPQPTNGP